MILGRGSDVVQGGSYTSQLAPVRKSVQSVRGFLTNHGVGGSMRQRTKSFHNSAAPFRSRCGQGATSSYIFFLSDTLWLKPRPQPAHLASYWAWLKRSLLQEAHVHCGKKQECARHLYKSAAKRVCETVFRHVPNYDPR